ncbi:uncharacterized protein LOC124259679 isoform X2 [Haliotis rubra]|uniref:uncharacterized protein LOC124259679 isoform X2 n=1 Tax=Haliotis rubra TaxID=36100 RepID=UPI001EE5E3E8|nr:uncharacterized protein LOC124259679 isoform X2 [Haliotis rubra]
MCITITSPYPRCQSRATASGRLNGRVLKIEKWNPDSDGELTQANMKKKLKSQGYNCIQYTFTPGTDFPDHTHAVSKKDSITSGQFQFTMYGQTVILEPGDMIDVPANTVHNACVVGSKSVVFFDATK